MVVLDKTRLIDDLPTSNLSSARGFLFACFERRFHAKALPRVALRSESLSTKKKQKTPRAGCGIIDEKRVVKEKDMTATGDIEFKTAHDRLYEGLDAAHTPRLFVPEVYVEKGSRHLELLAARALLDSQMFPTKQFDVVWIGSRVTRSLRADLQVTGRWDHSFGHMVEGSDEHFLVDPGLIWNLPGGATSYPGRIEQALENGASVFSPADLARAYEK